MTLTIRSGLLQVTKQVIYETQADGGWKARDNYKFTI